MLLVALHLLAEFGALQMLRFPTFTTAIYDQYRSTFNGHAANLLASVVVFACLLLLVVELSLRGRLRYARVGSGAARPPSRIRLGRWTPLALMLPTSIVCLSLGVPLWSLVHWLRSGSSTSFPVETLMSTTVSSLRLGLLGAVLTTALAIPVAWLAVRHRGPFTTLVERSTYIGHSLPGIVIALALVTISIRYIRPAYQTTALLLVAYAILFLPLAIVSLRSALGQSSPRIDEAAASLGAGPLTVLRRVTLPIIAPGIGASIALVFLSVVTELTATLLLAPTGTTTLASRFWSHSESIDYGAAAPYALLMIAISAPATYLLTRDARRSTIQ
jgi:iron(III) transport system permease protein